VPEKQFTTPNPIAVQVRVASGEIQISTVDGDQSSVVFEGSQKLLDAVKVDLVGDRLVIDERRKSAFGFLRFFEDALRVDVRVPHGSRVEMTSASAEAKLDGSFAGLDLTSAAGKIVATGEIDGDVRVKTVSGDVYLPRVTGDANVHTVSGDVEADSVDGSVSARSVSGSVRIGALHEGRVNVQSVSGDVELGIASGTSIDVDANSASGELSSEVPLSDRPGATDAGPTLVIRSNTVSGDFRVFRAA
jgi:putative adhesin